MTTDPPRDRGSPIHALFLGVWLAGFGTMTVLLAVCLPDVRPLPPLAPPPFGHHAPQSPTFPTFGVVLYATFASLTLFAVGAIWTAKFVLGKPR